MKRIIPYWEAPNMEWYRIPFLVFLIIMIIIGYFFLKMTINHQEKEIKWTVFIFGITFLLLETNKQFKLNFLDEREIYSWSAFPFQLCSTPLYFCLLSIVVKERKSNAIYAYLASYSFLGGASVLIYPNSVLTHNILGSFSSLFWHAIMLIISLYLILHNKYGNNIKQFIDATIIFICVVIIAMIMNEIFEYFKNSRGIDASFNMLYISPYYESKIPIMANIWKATNWVVFVLIYACGIPVCAYLIWLISHLIKKKFVRHIKVDTVEEII